MSIQDFIGHRGISDLGDCILLGFSGYREVYLTKHFVVETFEWAVASEEALETRIMTHYRGNELAPNIQIGGINGETLR